MKLNEGQQVSMALMQGRAGRLAWIMALLAGLVALRLLDLQVIRRPFLLARAESQELRKVDVAAKRGNITDRHHEPLAQQHRDRERLLLQQAGEAQKDDHGPTSWPGAWAGTRANPKEMRPPDRLGQVVLRRPQRALGSDGPPEGSQDRQPLSFDAGDLPRVYPEGRLAGPRAGLRPMWTARAWTASSAATRRPWAAAPA